MEFRISKHVMAVTLLLVSLLSIGRAADDAADLQKKGIEALKESQTNPDAIVTAARYFAKASAAYTASNQTDK